MDAPQRSAYSLERSGLRDKPLLERLLSYPNLAYPGRMTGELSREATEILGLSGRISDGLSASVGLMMSQSETHMLMSRNDWVIGCTRLREGNNAFSSTMLYQSMNGEAQVTLSPTFNTVQAVGLSKVHDNLQVMCQLEQDLGSLSGMPFYNVGVEMPFKSSHLSAFYSPQGSKLEFMQTLSAAVAVGMHMELPAQDKSVVQYVGRYTKGKNTVACNYLLQKSVMELYYSRAVNPQFTLASSFQTCLATMDSMWNAGFKYSPQKDASVTATVDNAGTVTSLMEYRVLEAVRAGVSSSLNHAKNEAKFGLTINIGME